MRQLTIAAIFVAAPKKNRYLAVHFTKGCFFCQFVDRKVVGLVPKYFLLAGDTSQVSTFSLLKLNISKSRRFTLQNYLLSIC